MWLRRRDDYGRAPEPSRRERIDADSPLPPVSRTTSVDGGIAAVSEGWVT